jgi:hypothetical protein
MKNLYKIIVGKLQERGHFRDIDVSGKLLQKFTFAIE